MKQHHTREANNSRHLQYSSKFRRFASKTIVVQNLEQQITTYNVVIQIDNETGDTKIGLEQILCTKNSIREQFKIPLRSLRCIKVDKSTEKLMQQSEDSSLLAELVFKHIAPKFFIHQKSFIAHLGNFTAIISHSDCKLFNIQSESTSGKAMLQKFCDSFLSSFNREQSNRATPFERMALDAVLSAKVMESRKTLNALFADCEQLIQKDKIVSNEKKFMDLKLSVSEQEKKMEGIIRAISDLLNENEDMAAMYLTYVVS